MIPYFGYARQDRKPGPRTPISAKLVANMIDRAGADRVLTLDLHAGQIQGFFDIPTDNLFAAPVMVQDMKQNFDANNLMVVSPDVGGVVRARGVAKRIDAPLAIVDKRRERPGDFEVMNVIGDVAGRSCLLVDDIVDSGGTLVNAAEALLNQGATRGHGLYQSWRLVRRRRRPHQQLATQGAGDHRLDPAERGGGKAPEHPHIADRVFAWRSDRPHGGREVGLEPVLLGSARYSANTGAKPPPGVLKFVTCPW